MTLELTRIVVERTTSSTTSYSQLNMHRPPTKLIDYAFVIGVDHRGATATAEASTNAAGSSSSSLSSCPSTTATTYFCYPPIPTGHEGALNNITPFCFPEAVVVVHDNVNSNNTVLASSSTGTTSTPPRHHDFVLTDEKGQKRFASCLRTSAVQVVTSEGTTGKSEASTYAFCLVSNQPRFNRWDAWVCA